MQQTTNFQLPIIELEDNYDIEVFNEGNRITDTQLKALKDMADSWIAFKNTGGEIGGSNGTKLLIDGRKIEGIGDALELRGKGSNPLYLTKNGTFNVTQLIPSVDCELGSSTNRWKEIYMGNYSVSTNGYTKLPNGMIMQWGSISLTSGSKTDFTPPIAFPTQCLIISATLVGGTTYSNLGVTSGINSNNSLYALQSTGATRPVNWFAIGY